MLIIMLFFCSFCNTSKISINIFIYYLSLQELIRKTFWLRTSQGFEAIKFPLHKLCILLNILGPFLFCIKKLVIDGLPFCISFLIISSYFCTMLFYCHLFGMLNIFSSVKTKISYCYGMSYFKINVNHKYFNWCKFFPTVLVNETVCAFTMNFSLLWFGDWRSNFASTF